MECAHKRDRVLSIKVGVRVERIGEDKSPLTEHCQRFALHLRDRYRSREAGYWLRTVGSVRIRGELAAGPDFIHQCIDIRPHVRETGQLPRPIANAMLPGKESRPAP